MMVTHAHANSQMARTLRSPTVSCASQRLVAVSSRLVARLAPRISTCISSSQFPCLMCVVCRTILVIKAKWGEKILNGVKTLEIRRGPCPGNEGTRIGLCFSGTSAIYGFVDLLDSCGPLTRSEWCALRDRHCVPGEKLPYGANTCAWVMANPERLDTPLGIERKKGAVIFQSVDLRGR